MTKIVESNKGRSKQNKNLGKKLLWPALYFQCPTWCHSLVCSVKVDNPHIPIRSGGPVWLDANFKIHTTQTAAGNRANELSSWWMIIWEPKIFLFLLAILREYLNPSYAWDLFNDLCSFEMCSFGFHYKLYCTEVRSLPLINFQKLFWNKVFGILELVRTFKFYIGMTISGSKSVKRVQKMLKKA